MRQKESFSVKIYHGYGHQHDLVIYGHAFYKAPHLPEMPKKSVFPNMLDLIRLFIVKPVPFARLRLHWDNDSLETLAQTDGFFKFEWKAGRQIEAGWHIVKVDLLNDKGSILATGEGGVYVPHRTQYAFISDIDDTVMVSHSSTLGKRLLELSLKNPHTRGIFPDVALHYKLLSLAHTDADLANPFFYVSSSEWNLYDYLNRFFTFNGLPKGAFLLNSLKQWHQFFKSGNTEHQGKLLRITRIMDTFPEQKFGLFGDNSQEDPAIYASAAEKFGNRIKAVYIRNAVPGHEAETRLAFQSMSRYGIETLLFNESREAIAHSREVGLINA